MDEYSALVGLAQKMSFADLCRHCVHYHEGGTCCFCKAKSPINPEEPY